MSKQKIHELVDLFNSEGLMLEYEMNRVMIVACLVWLSL
jgi:hypothetical protein